MKKYVKEIVATALIVFCFLLRGVAYLSTYFLSSNLGFQIWFYWPIFEFALILTTLLTVTYMVVPFTTEVPTAISWEMI